MDNHIKTAEKLDSSELIKGNKKDMPIRTQIPLAITYHGILSSSQIIWKTGTYYQLTNLWKKIQNEPVAAFKRNKNLKELTGSNKIENKIVKKIKKALWNHENVPHIWK